MVLKIKVYSLSLILRTYQATLKNEPLTASIQLFLSGISWNSEYRSLTMHLYTHTLTHVHSHTHSHCLSLVLVVMIKSQELKTKISHTHSLILSLILARQNTDYRPTLDRHSWLILRVLKAWVWVAMCTSVMTTRWRDCRYAVSTTTSPTLAPSVGVSPMTNARVSINWSQYTSISTRMS